MPTTTLRIWRGQDGAGGFQDYPTEVSEGMVVLDAVHQVQASRPTIWRCAGTARPASADPARRK